MKWLVASGVLVALLAVGAAILFEAFRCQGRATPWRRLAAAPRRPLSGSHPSDVWRSLGSAGRRA